MPIRIALGLGVTVIAFAVAGRRFAYLLRLIGKGRSDPARFSELRSRAWAELSEVGGQRKLLRWSVPGLAHAFTFWGFTVLLLTILEAYGGLFDRDFFIPLVGRGRGLGFVEDFFAVAVLVALGVFTVIRYANAPKRRGRLSRFFGSHTGAAWLTLAFITVAPTTSLREAGELMLEPGLESEHERLASFLPCRATRSGGLAIDRLLDHVKPGDTLERFARDRCMTVLGNIEELAPQMGPTEGERDRLSACAAGDGLVGCISVALHDAAITIEEL